MGSQRKIASILSAYDDLIENNTRRIHILEEMAAAIYREWFVEFRYPGHERVPLVDSELGPIPEGWSIRMLSMLARITMGQSPPSAAYNRKGIGLPFHQGVGTYGTHYPVHQVHSTSGLRIAEPGDTLVSVRAPVGRINIADRRLILGRGVCAVGSGGAPNGFLLHALKDVFREEDAMGNGSIFKAVTRGDMERIPVRWPGDEHARRFGDTVAPMWELIGGLTIGVGNLRAARDLLLPRLISGEIDVSDLDIDTSGLVA